MLFLFFIEENSITGMKYFQILQTWILNNKIRTTIVSYFKRTETQHWQSNVQFINDTLTERWTGHSSPSRSPNMTPCNFLCGEMNERVFLSLAHSLDELTQAINNSDFTLQKKWRTSYRLYVVSDWWCKRSTYKEIVQTFWFC